MHISSGMFGIVVLLPSESLTMDRRELFGALGALGAVPVCAAVGSAGTAADPKKGPLGHDHLHVCGIHMAKANPKLQFITHHYCVGQKRGAAGDVYQCMLFDGTGSDAKLIGVEYIISDAAYRKLPAEEKKYWHPHTYEVLGGGLIAPGMDPKAEMDVMELVLTTWGKAWHTWPNPAEDVPIGPPMLIWSLMGDGQVDKNVLAQRDQQFNIDTKKLCEARGKAIGLETPNVSLPEDENSIGRQWTNNGKDEPTRKR
jgi:hypothetical protein